MIKANEAANLSESVIGKMLCFVYIKASQQQITHYVHKKLFGTLDHGREADGGPEEPPAVVGSALQASEVASDAAVYDQGVAATESSS